eukprot:scaffold124073_cov18-Tisochrysis_lutea.AAC.1
MARLLGMGYCSDQGSGQHKYPTHIQEDCVEDYLCTLRLFAQSNLLLLRPLAGLKASYFQNI